ncbi:hypothetical protein CDHC01_0656 [Corynebacterium diphtheriae HC01]|uniref:DUF3152 domain-containing protein n=1 Tax=Corynebacterium diphtheriae bv. gravis TaxID=1720349 RepID=A0AAX0J3S7_CORDP|nr:DUF3152 domain-containing protein [Corynebacterium diphtheriae]ERA58046.1 hypothetical protein B178_03016 [Corynebacterium diphtheriae DSM 43988]AEX43723.1 hypothetical protein CD241_0656 [Corynebacterium diphtheriae 241]AEX66867.1 hypothetical protein CDC7B_0670 [Corynebacterium diphtheriae C7 (beta)]AEX73909.1 hypothetical protein CDHC01_0656 [Corynebacterium diphtheriae HC01]EIK57016.1 hypothetical protein W5M_03321 [Corynebacterium diphtheriae bv. intermedius str. NCTC 5011]
MTDPHAESFFVRFARDYGWRAYAIPVLAVITVWVLIDVFRTPAETTTTATVGGAPTATATSAQEKGPDPARQNRPDIAITELPSGPEFTQKGEGTYRTVGNAGAHAGKDRDKVFTYVIEVENGINTAAYGGDDAFAAMVDATLTNPKSWTHDKRFGFEHVDAGAVKDPDLRIQLSSVDTTHGLCGNNIAMETSCFYGIGNRVVINESRWVRGAKPFQGDLGAYRQYLINHEVGHGIGFANHEPCGKNGELAPIMMQQTLSLSNSELFAIDANEIYNDDGAVCSANPWPYPFA